MEPLKHLSHCLHHLILHHLVLEVLRHHLSHKTALRSRFSKFNRLRAKFGSSVGKDIPVSLKLVRIKGISIAFLEL